MVSSVLDLSSHATLSNFPPIRYTSSGKEERKRSARATCLQNGETFAVKNVTKRPRWRRLLTAIIIHSFLNNLHIDARVSCQTSHSSDCSSSLWSPSWPHSCLPSRQHAASPRLHSKSWQVSLSAHPCSVGSSAMCRFPPSRSFGCASSPFSLAVKSVFTACE